VGFFYPDIWMRDIRKKQVDAVLKNLPTYLDFITMAIQAGLNFSGAIEQARKKALCGSFVIEFGISLKRYAVRSTEGQDITANGRKTGYPESNKFC
jgi:tight adherence protein C